jgi:short-subunit dehydrogenase
MNKFSLTGCSALITGASAGIGREFALQLAGRARALVLVARRRDRLEALRDELRARNPNLLVHFHDHDLSKPWQLNEFLIWLTRMDAGIDLVINNAGLGDSGPFATSEPERVDEMVMVNVVALTHITRHLLPDIIARKRGAILNVSSSASFLPMPGMAVYAATKAYVTSFSEALRVELRGTGVSVTSVCPGPVHTEFAAMAKRSSDRPHKMSPEFTHVGVDQVVRDALCALEHDRPLVIPGVVMKIAMFIIRLMPLALLRLGGRLSRRA